MKSALLFLLIITVNSVSAQKKIPTTDQFTIEGKLKQTLSVAISSFKDYTVYTVDSIVIRNHLLERRSTLKNVKGILLKDVLNKMEIDVESPKYLSEFYFVCIASDGYKVVFSWNEIFNTELSKSIFIITEVNGEPAAQSSSRIAIISPDDYATGRRYVKGLQKIVVERAK